MTKNYEFRQILDKEPYDDFVIEDNILKKHQKGKNVVCVPKCLQFEIIKTAHENGHFSLKKMRESIVRWQTRR